jgi:hypothetical protein
VVETEATRRTLLDDSFADGAGDPVEDLRHRDSSTPPRGRGLEVAADDRGRLEHLAGRDRERVETPPDRDSDAVGQPRVERREISASSLPATRRPCRISSR